MLVLLSPTTSRYASLENIGNRTHSLYVFLHLMRRLWAASSVCVEGSGSLRHSLADAELRALHTNDIISCYTYGTLHIGAVKVPCPVIRFSDPSFLKSIVHFAYELSWKELAIRD